MLCFPPFLMLPNPQPHLHPHSTFPLSALYHWNPQYFHAKNDLTVLWYFDWCYMAEVKLYTLFHQYWLFVSVSVWFASPWVQWVGRWFDYCLNDVMLPCQLAVVITSQVTWPHGQVTCSRWRGWWKVTDQLIWINLKLVWTLNYWRNTMHCVSSQKTIKSKIS